MCHGDATPSSRMLSVLATFFFYLASFLDLSIPSVLLYDLLQSKCDWRNPFGSPCLTCHRSLGISTPQRRTYPNANSSLSLSSSSVDARTGLSRACIWIGTSKAVRGPIFLLLSSSHSNSLLKRQKYWKKPLSSSTSSFRISQIVTAVDCVRLASR